MTMALKVISAVDGTNIERMLATHLDKFCDTIVISFDEAVASVPLITKSVFVLLLTPVMLQELTNKVNAIKELLSYSEKLVVFHACQDEKLKDAKNLLLTNKKRGVSLNQYDMVDTGQLFIGEAKIKELMSKHQDSILLPIVNKYMLKPERISQGQSSVLVILFDECQPDRVTVQSDLPGNNKEKISAKSIRSGVWSFSAEGLVPGKHTLVVCIDDNNIGTATLTVQSTMDVMTEALATVVQEQPKEFLARVMGIQEVDNGDLDDQLEDIFQSSLRENSLYPFSKLALGLLQIGEEGGKGYTFPHFLHFCAKFGLSRTCKWILNNVPQDRTACNIRNKDNQTPSMMVNDDTKLKQILKKETSDEDETVETVLSPLSMSGNKRNSHINFLGKSGSIDSGNGGSDGSAQDNTEPDVRSSSYPFQKSTRTHPYSEIVDERSSADTMLIQRKSDSHTKDGADLQSGSSKIRFYKSKREHPYSEINTDDVFDDNPVKQESKSGGHVNDKRFVFNSTEKVSGYELPWDQKPLPVGPMPYARRGQTLPRQAQFKQHEVKPESYVKRHNSMDTGPTHIQLKSCDHRNSTKL